MSKNGKDRRPYLPPVQRIQLSEKNIRLRMVLLVLLLSVAVVAVVVGLGSALNTEPGWQTVEANSSQINCSRDFVLQYDCGQGSVSATEEYRALTALYTQLTEKGYVLFSPEAEGDGNLAELNRRPNQAVSLVPEVYEAVALLVEQDSRYPFLAPAAAQYGSVFLAATDAEAAQWDPGKDPEKGDFVRQAARFAADPQMIRLELLGNNQAKLTVSEAYLTFAAENGITVFLDLGWMKNAFIADFLAEALAERGFTRGYLASFDGFTRNLDQRGLDYSYNLFDRLGNTICIPASLGYDRPVSIATLRSFPLSEEDRWSYYAYEDGSVTHTMLDLADGSCRQSTDILTGYSYERSCAELAVKLAPVYIAAELDTGALQALEGEGIHTLWAEDTVLCHSEETAQLTLRPDSGGGDYSIR